MFVLEVVGSSYCFGAITDIPNDGRWRSITFIHFLDMFTYGLYTDLIPITAQCQS